MVVCEGGCGGGHGGWRYEVLNAFVSAGYTNVILYLLPYELIPSNA